MCVRSWGLVRNREFMGGQAFGVSVESIPKDPSCIGMAPCALQHSGGYHISDGQQKHLKIADNPTYTRGSGMSRKMYLLQARRLNGRQVWIGPPSRRRIPH
jgi:hypothetical protein